MTPAVLRKLAAELRGPPRPGENVRAAEALEAAAAQFEAVGTLRAAAEGVVQSYAAGEGPRMPAVGALARALEELGAWR